MAEELRRTTLTALSVALATAAGLTATFHLLLAPVQEDSCNTSLLDSTFKTALVPMHLVAAVLLSACLLALAPRPPTVAALGAFWAGALACVIEPGLFGPLALLSVLAAPTAGLALVGALALRTLQARRSGAPPEALWSDHARSVRILLWTALLLGLPASLAYAWLSGASAFCF